jgi:hypothetical protein
MTDIPWKPDRKVWSATKAERAIVHGPADARQFELGVMELPAHRIRPRLIAWEIRTGPPEYADFAATSLLPGGQETPFESYEDAKAACIAAWRRLLT